MVQQTLHHKSSCILSTIPSVILKQYVYHFTRVNKHINYFAPTDYVRVATAVHKFYVLLWRVNSTAKVMYDNAWITQLPADYVAPAK